MGMHSEEVHYGSGLTLGGPQPDEFVTPLQKYDIPMGDAFVDLRKLLGMEPKSRIGARAEDDGVQYDDDESSVMWLRIGMPADRIPPHTQELLQGPVVEALKRFITRNVEYGETADALGSRGQYADINRKVGKLKRLMWDKNVPEWSISEPTKEVLEDLIGHCILSLYYIDKEEQDGK